MRSRLWGRRHGHRTGTGILRIHSVDALMESRKDLGSLEGGHIEESAPNSGGGEATDSEARNDAEIIGTAFEGAPEVRVSRCGGCSEGARGKNDFIAEDVGAN